jgi:hypothetical protein
MQITDGSAANFRYINNVQDLLQLTPLSTLGVRNSSGSRSAGGPRAMGGGAGRASAHRRYPFNSGKLVTLLAPGAQRPQPTAEEIPAPRRRGDPVSVVVTGL